MVSRSSHQEHHNVGELSPSSVANPWRKPFKRQRKCKKRGLTTSKKKERLNKMKLIWEHRWNWKLSRSLKKRHMQNTTLKNPMVTEFNKKIPTPRRKLPQSSQLMTGHSNNSNKWRQEWRQCHQLWPQKSDGFRSQNQLKERRQKSASVDSKNYVPKLKPTKVRKINDNKLL